ncbi:MAG: hypothetical protein CMP76_09355 [Flavobacterium sp.]|uniref:LamG-like jellyroll fold domain-containing protein n=1 Tax=Flavobacterium sp. TaxID=239 RepID=UPI000C484B91|nr:LamG-like jellyroll fold domain-containing protein [Flavobacterium sp.]MBF03489.1 hypothetical protein [Flavobacterium sp.]
MKQKYFVTFLFSFGFILTFGQNNAINLTGNNGFYFSGPNGTSDYHLNLSNFTVEYDFYLNSVTNTNARFTSNGYQSIIRPIEFYIDGIGNSVLRLGDGTNTETIPGTPSFSVGQWYHVAFAVNNTATKNIKMYVNGVPIVDYSFTVSLGTNSTSYEYIGFGGGSSSNMDCKLDNLRIWSSLRTDTEIATNYNTCLNNNEPNLDYYFNFERSNNAIIKNQVINQSCKIGVASSNFSFSTGTGCTVPYGHAPITLTGDYAGIYYYVDDVNGKPHYKTDDFDCNCISAESLCDFANTYNNDIYEMYWDNNQWVLIYGGCTWLFTTCENNSDLNSSFLATNTTDSPLAPCTGWVFDQATASGTFTSDDCPALSNTSFNSEGFTLYPNPSKGIFLITSNEALSLEVFDLLGNTILDQKMDTPTTSFDLSKNAKGVYILKVTDKNGNASFQRIIKE